MSDTYEKHLVVEECMCTKCANFFAHTHIEGTKEVQCPRCNYMGFVIKHMDWVGRGMDE